MTCPNCGVNLDNNATECFLCGYRIDNKSVSDDEQDFSVNTCAVCGFEISEQDSVCPLCGSPIEKTAQTESEQEEYSTEDIDKSPSKNKFAKRLVIVIISVIFLATIGILAFLFLNKEDKSSSQSDTSQTETTTELNTESTTAEATTAVTTTKTTTAENTETYTDVSSYIGFWHEDNGSYERELTISSVKKNNIIFSLWYYRLDSFDNVPATLENDTAYFNADGIQGYLTFENDTVTVVVTNSSRPYITPAVMNFVGRHDHSWEDEGFGVDDAYELNVTPVDPYIIKVANPELNIYETPSYSAKVVGKITNQSEYTIVEEYIEPRGTSMEAVWGKLKSGVGWVNILDATQDPYFFFDEEALNVYDETPNVWCPNCNYGFFITGVGTDGFYCPRCGYNWTL